MPTRTEVTDAKFRQYILATVVTILLTVAGCVAQTTIGRIDTLEAADSDRKVEGAVLKKEVEDFRKSFEDFKQDVKDDIDRHHR